MSALKLLRKRPAAGKAGHFCGPANQPSTCVEDAGPTGPERCVRDWMGAPIAVLTAVCPVTQLAKQRVLCHHTTWQ
jgi:hypothetical protein